MNIVKSSGATPPDGESDIKGRNLVRFQQGQPNQQKVRLTDKIIEQVGAMIRKALRGNPDYIIDEIVDKTVDQSLLRHMDEDGMIEAERLHHAWLRRRATQHITRYYKKYGFRTEIDISECGDAVAEDTDPYPALQRSEEAEMFWRAVVLLRDHQKEFMMFVVEAIDDGKFSYEELARRFSVRQPACKQPTTGQGVAQKYHQTLARLRTILANYT